jgi:hypothetical protein
MKKAKDVTRSGAMLKWLTTTILVLGIITFSGHAAALKPYNSELVKVELSEARKVSSKKIVHFKKARADEKCSRLIPESRAKNVISFLSHKEKKVAITLKSHSKKLGARNEQGKGFLIHFSTNNSEEFESIPPRG